MTDLELPDVRKESEQAELEASVWEHASDHMLIETDGQYTMAVECLREVKDKMNTLEEQRKQATKPLMEAKRAVDTWFKPAGESLRKAERSIKRAIAKFHDVRKAESKKVLEEVSQAVKAGNQEIATARLKALPANTDKVSTRESWKFEVSNVSLLPREYLTPDLKKIGAVVRTLKGDSDIPGVNIRVEKQVVVR